MEQEKRDPDETIVITPQMLSAGAQVLFSSFGDVLLYGSSLEQHVAGEVFSAMVLACRERNSHRKRTA